MHRNTDQEAPKAFQTERFFRSEDMWYFTTREGIDFGPFTIRGDGEKALFRYLDTQLTMRTLRNRDPNIADDYKWDDQGVAEAANEVAEWRFDRSERSNDLYADREESHK